MSSEDARRLFRYVTVDEWVDYRRIVAVFANTFFAEFAPEDVAGLLASDGIDIDPAVVADRLEQLRRWGNLTVSSSVGNPNSISDYYRRRNRYLITRAGQEVHGLVEGVLSRIDEVRDVSTSRLRSLRDALGFLISVDFETIDPEQLSDAVRNVFDPHEAFTSEITQFFAAINQWQARYDLNPEEFRFFAEVLVGYVGDRLDEIQRTARPIGRLLTELGPHVPKIVERISSGSRGLATRVDRAGLSDSVAVSRQRGSITDDWDHINNWFVATPIQQSRIDRLGRDAISAIRTLTLNLTRLSRIGVGASSRRADFLRLATFFDTAADSDECHRLSAAAFGMFAPVHLGRPSDDSADPTPVSVSWWDAPKASVAVSLRERGDTTNRGSTTPLRDLRGQQLVIRQKREAAAIARAEVDSELIAIGDLNGATISIQALPRVQQLLSRASRQPPEESGERRILDQQIACVVRTIPGSTAIASPEGSLTLYGVGVSFERVEE
ncbi:MAG: DUF2397 domain-containing protein [Microthrixaceae bacterium]|nr:DUF2397 domain-containing protein [Microthrixaceae bacterium]